MDDTETPVETSTTSPPEIGSTSSTPTATSPSTNDTVAQLGERILTELDANRTNDTLTRWLAHHTATLITAADQAATTGQADAHTRAAEARDAILQLWEHRSAWPNGWPPPRAAAIAKLLTDLPSPDASLGYHSSGVAVLHDLHHHILAALVDVATANDESLEDGWITQFGSRLTEDEKTLLTYAAAADDRVGRLVGWQLAREAAPRLGDWAGNDPDDGHTNQGDEDQPGHPLVELANTYRQMILEVIQGATKRNLTDE